MQKRESPRGDGCGNQTWDRRVSDRSIEIREAVTGDAKALAEYAGALFAERLTTIFLHDNPPTQEDQLRFIQGFEADNAHLLVAVDGDGIVGMAGFKGHGRPQLRHAGIIGFGVALPFRRQGVGLRLLNGLITWAEADPLLSRIECDVFATNTAALSLLEKTGFEREGTMRRAIEVGGEKIDNYLLARIW